MAIIAAPDWAFVFTVYRIHTISHSSAIMPLHHQAYVGHDQWPKNAASSARDHDALSYLAEWARNVISFAALLDKAGGQPAALCRYPSGLLAAVVPVLDDHTSAQEDYKANVKRG